MRSPCRGGLLLVVRTFFLVFFYQVQKSRTPALKGFWLKRLNSHCVSLMCVSRAAGTVPACTLVSPQPVPPRQAQREGCRGPRLPPVLLRSGLAFVQGRAMAAGHGCPSSGTLPSRPAALPGEGGCEAVVCGPAAGWAVPNPAGPRRADALTSQA